MIFNGKNAIHKSLNSTFAYRLKMRVTPRVHLNEFVAVGHVYVPSVASVVSLFASLDVQHLNIDMFGKKVSYNEFCTTILSVVQ